MEKKTKYCLFFLIIYQMILLIGCSSVSGKNFKDDEAMLYGMVYNDNDEALRDVEVVVDGKLKAVSDMQGRFILKYMYGNIMERKRHTIELHKRGYETIKELIFYDPMSLLYFRMESGKAIQEMAESLIDRGSYNEADKALNRLLGIEGKEDIGLYLLAILRIKEGKESEAIHLLEDMENKDNIYVKNLLETIK